MEMLKGIRALCCGNVLKELLSQEQNDLLLVNEAALINVPQQGEQTIQIIVLAFSVFST